jgi:hypothetical protein
MRIRHLALLVSFAPLHAADLQPVRTVTLAGDTRHVQGIDCDDRRLWVTSVDRSARQGWLMEFSPANGERLRAVDVTAGERYHPGGMTADGDSLWIPVAEYRRASTSVIQKRNARTLELESQFEVADHIGCIAAAPGVLIGANWDSRDFYVWDRSGKLLRKVPNPTPNGYQDLKFVDGQLVGGGLLPGRAGAVDWLDYPSFRLVRRLDFGKTSRGVPYTNEGMAIRGDRLLLLPEDAPSRLFEFRIPPPTEPGYQALTVAGWRVLAEEALPATELAPVLDELRSQLHGIVRMLPGAAVERLRAVPVWIHRKSATRCMAFHPSAVWLGEHGFNPHMANGIEIGNVATFLAWVKYQPWMVLHELAHAYHFRRFGFDHPEIKRTWQAAVAAGTYDSVLHIDGTSKRHYALRDQQEYFAELSESYFGTNDFYPFVRAELRRHDAAGWQLIRRLWGVEGAGPAQAASRP